MNFYPLLIALQVVSAVVIIVLVLLQQGKGADMGAAFGSGASGSLFGASGSANFLSRATAIAATCFFVFTMLLTLVAAKGRGDQGVLQDYQTNQPASSVPATPPSSAPLPVAPTEGSKTKQIPQ